MDVFLVGAPKSATTTLADLMVGSGAVSVPERKPKEIHFFGSDLRIRRAPMSLVEYEALFERQRDDRLRLDASVCYLMSELAAEEIASYKPSARVIICLRDPISMVPSLHAQLVKTGDEPLTDFAAALQRTTSVEDADLSGLATARAPAQIFGYDRVASYDVQLRRYVEAFPAAQLLILSFDDISNRLALIARRVSEFLEVDSASMIGYIDEVEGLKLNVAQRPRSTVLNRFLRNPPSMLRGNFTARSTRRVRRAMVGLNLTETTSHVDAGARAILRDWYEPSCRRLAELADDIDIRGWCQP